MGQTYTKFGIYICSVSTFATTSIFKRNQKIIDTKYSNVTLHRTQDLQFILDASNLSGFHFFSPRLSIPLTTNLKKWSWMKFGNCLTLAVDSIPIPLLCQAVKNMLAATLLVCQTLNFCRILTLVICYIRVEILFF